MITQPEAKVGEEGGAPAARPTPHRLAPSVWSLAWPRYHHCARSHSHSGDLAGRELLRAQHYKRAPWMLADEGGGVYERPDRVQAVELKNQD